MSRFTTVSDVMSPARILHLVLCWIFLPTVLVKGADNRYFFHPGERNYAEIQPPIYSNSRQQDELTERSAVYGPSHYDIYQGEEFPSPNYNQNPAPFQLPTGRSQAGGQYYLNQAEYKPPYRATFRPFPQNPDPSTRRPEIHSYQHDPAQPEEFLGQITLNNAETEDLSQINKFRQFDENALRSGNSPLSDIDFFNSQRITTYNPNKNPNRVLVKSQHRAKNFFDQSKFGEFFNDSDFSKRKPVDSFNSQVVTDSNHAKPITGKQVLPYMMGVDTFDGSSNKPKNIHPASNSYDVTTHRQPVRSTGRGLIHYRGVTTYKPPKPSITTAKANFPLQPLLEDITDFISYKDNKKKKDFDDVEVIKSSGKKGSTEKSSFVWSADNNPSASTVGNEHSMKSNDQSEPSPYHDHKADDEVLNEDHDKVNFTGTLSDLPEQPEAPADDEFEYYDEELESTTSVSKETSMGPEEYDEPTEVIHDDENVSDNFEILNTSKNTTMVADDQFKDFVDNPVMDSPDIEEPIEPIVGNLEEIELPQSEVSHSKTANVEQEVVSVVTTKSVVNGTYSVPDQQTSTSTSKPHTTLIQNSEKSVTTSSSSNTATTTPVPLTTESWVVVASVQTSRSVSGARFLPFPAVEQEEKKQVLTDDDLEVTPNPRDLDNGTTAKSSSTESINDKLDSIQSELASSVLSGNFREDNKNIALLKEVSTASPITTPAPPIKLFTVKSTVPSHSTERSAPELLSVTIKKYAPHIRSTTTTTSKPKRKPSFEVSSDELSGLLPPGFKPKQSYRDRKKPTTTTTTEEAVLSSEELIQEEKELNSTQGRSSGLTSKNKLAGTVSKEANKNKNIEQKSYDSLFKDIKLDDISKFLPPGFAQNQTTTPTTAEKTKVMKTGLFTPKSRITSTGVPTSTTTKPVNKILAAAKPVDISSFLPPGFKLDSKENDETPAIKEDLLSKVKTVDVSNFLPPGFKEDSGSKEVASQETTTKTSSGFKVVFPSKPGAKTTRKTTAKPNLSGGPGPVVPVIQKGWPTRATTEFTGWPSPSTTPFSIEKLLAERNLTASTHEQMETTKPIRKTTTSTTSTTTQPPSSTTPGVCTQNCDLAATIKIVGGVKWVPELLDHNTLEWRQLAEEVSESLNSVYTESEELSKWYKGVRIDAFSKGSVLVDYFIELNSVDEAVDTVDLKRLFHKSLNKAKPGSAVTEVEELHPFNPDMMIGDQPEEERLVQVKKTVDISDGKLTLGKFVMDPNYTEFIVLRKNVHPGTVNMAAVDQDALLPQWGIAVIVIAMASLLFVVIFGVTVLVNRQKSAKAKQPIPISEEMLRELDNSHMGGSPEHPTKDREFYTKERDLYPSSGKRLSAGMLDQMSYPGAPGDSWRSEWTPQLHKYMQQQHYTPDSGRGSQTYGAHGGMHYGYGSQLYGYGGGSQVYGYHGEGIPRTHFSRRRSAYDGGF